MVQDPGKDATPQDEDVSDTAAAPEDEKAEEDRKVRSDGSQGRSWRERLSAWASREYWRELSWRDLPGLGSTATAWHLRGLWQRGESRFEPGPLGLLGVMLAAMAITMLLLQTGSGGVGGDGAGRADEPVSIPDPPEGELRIMPLGGAATQGSDGDHTWRYHLWSHLTEQEVEFDFVGPHDDLYSLEEEDFGNHDYAAPDFDTDHAARWGSTAQDLADEAARTAAEHEPHYLLLLAGTEDIIAGEGADHALEGIAEIVSTVRVVIGDARFVVGELPEVDGTSDDGRVNSEIELFNMGLVDLAEQLTSSDSPMVVAQTAQDYAPAYDNWDATHPNVRGELKIAAAFADALAEPLGVGDAFPRPLPEFSTGPLTAPEPEYEETEGGLRLSWPAVPGATDYRVVQRRIDPDPDDPFVLPMDVESDDDRRSVTIESLLSGAGYEFVVRPYKGKDEGVESDPLKLVWDDDPPPGPSGVRVRDGGDLVVWDEVEEAGHYEVWVRRLECAPTDHFQRPRDVDRSPRDTDTSTSDTSDADGGGEGPRPTPSEPPRPPRPEPEPTPTPAPSTPPPAPAPDPEPGASCSPRDDRGPGDGEDWHSLGPVEGDPRWRVTVSGPYEVVIRSYRDYVKGGYSTAVVLDGH
ncbi:hypothetical protein [Nocardiopsis alkaliphila]|uniref:hypothetical protein n=1 Tax=Nocardiopsis alkaliphila TaxID=225762 RepID=UPI000347DD88|nr:hypothetical protein [Nocardiopsis alkaliphila]